MILSLVNFLNNYWVVLLLCFLIITIIVVFFLFINQKYYKKEKTFKECLNDTKSQQISVIIDFEEKMVEKRYLYDQTNTDEIMTIDEFFVRFDRCNSEKFKKWLNNVSQIQDFNKTRRIELVMYENHERKVYMVDLESYNYYSKRYYLTFIDTTESMNVFNRIDKLAPSTIDMELFYQTANERLSVVDEHSNNFLIYIVYKEREYLRKEFPKDILNNIEESIYHRLNKDKLENELLSKTDNGAFVIFSTNVANIKKYKQRIKRILQRNSGVYDLAQHRFSYSINLYAGYVIIDKENVLSMDDTLKAEATADYAIKRGHFSDRLQAFDGNVQNTHTELNNMLLAVEKVVLSNSFEVKFTPIIDKENKEICGYFISIDLPKSLKISFTAFMDFIKRKSFRFKFFKNVFEQIITFKYNNKTSPNVFYFSFDFDHLQRVMEAYQSQSYFSELNIYFCVEFSNSTMQNNDLISIEKKLAYYQDTKDIKFGITYNSLTTIYLNSKIYLKADVVLLTGQLIDGLLDKYSNETLIDMYTNVAKSYNQEIIGLNVSSLAIYEVFQHNNINKFGGSLLTPYVTNSNKIVDKSLLKQLSDIENRKY
ncbi:MAG: hypothetical protein MR270_04940 [Erysipelotrichaceae bacterium]|nr:hypothetical protein [Erysipelotrichaceae bacterium]